MTDHQFQDAYPVARDATLAMKLAYLFSDSLGDLVCEGLHDEVRNNTTCCDDGDGIEWALEQAARDVDRMTPETIGALVTKLLTEQRATHAAQREALLARHGLDFGSMARAIVGAGK